MPQVISPCSGGGGGSTGAWALVRFSHAAGNAYQSIADSTNTAVIFERFETTDQTIFDTKPNGTAGDTRLAVFGAGVYTFEMGSGWQNTFAAQAFVYIQVQTYHGPSWTHPADQHINQAGAGAPFQNLFWDARVYPFTAADLGGSWAEITVQAYQASGVAQNLDQMWLRVAYVPTGDTRVVVY